MRDADLFRRLGFVRLGDYVAERLGFSYRTAQELMRVEESLARLPLTERAFDRGEISSGHVRLLSRVVVAADERFWVGLARRIGVRKLTEAIAGIKKDAADNDPAECGGVPGALAGATRDEVFSVSEEEPNLERLEISAPAWIATLWRESVTFVRWILGSGRPQGDCLEAVLAEVANALPPEEPELDDDEAQEPCADTPRSVSDSSSKENSWLESWSPPARLVTRPISSVNAGAAGGTVPAKMCRYALHSSASLESADDASPLGDDRPITLRAVDDGGACEGIQPGAHSGATLSEETALQPLDARAVDRELRLLVCERQRHEAALAAHLRAAAFSWIYRAREYLPLEAYAADLFGLSARSLYYLLALHRTLDSLPLLRAAYLEGRVTLKQALLLGAIASTATEAEWIHRAESVTLRRLDDEVSFWRHLKEARPGVWELLRGGPLPAGIALVPGQSPRLHASARGQGSDRTSTGAGAQVSAAVFIAALEADEVATPLPPRMCRIRMLVEPEIKKTWKETVAHCRSVVRPDLEEWETLALVLREFWHVWDNGETRRQRRENPTLERDGWRCMVPACHSIGTGTLHEHHVLFRSAGGTDEASNTTAVCGAHHLGLLHEGIIRCSGGAPDELLWELGIDAGRTPFLVYRGETKVIAASQAL